MLINGSVRLPANAIAEVQQSSLLGEQYVALSAPPGIPPHGAPGQRRGDPAGPHHQQRHRGGGASARCRCCSTAAGSAQLHMITTQLNAALAGNEPQIRALLGQLAHADRQPERPPPGHHQTALDGLNDAVGHAGRPQPADRPRARPPQPRPARCWPSSARSWSPCSTRCTGSAASRCTRSTPARPTSSPTCSALAADPARAGRRRAEPAAGPAGAAHLSVHRPGAQGHQGRLPERLPVHPGRARHDRHPAGHAARNAAPAQAPTAKGGRH